MNKVICVKYLAQYHVHVIEIKHTPGNIGLEFKFVRYIQFTLGDSDNVGYKISDCFDNYFRRIYPIFMCRKGSRTPEF